MGAAMAAGTAYTSGAPEFIPRFQYCSIFGFYVVFCSSLFIPCRLAIVLYILLTVSDYHYGIFKLLFFRRFQL